MQEVSIEFKNVVKEYTLYKSNKHRLMHLLFKRSKVSHKVAVDDVSFVINKGESVAFIGNNGAGKSTILKIISQISFPTSGEVTVNGTVGALIELTAGFDPEFTGRENIYLRGVILGIPKSEVDKMIEPILDFAELGEYIDQPVRTYSSGMKSRLGFSININLNPDILIVDEALSVGDANFKNKCKAKVAEYLEKRQSTLLFVTHSNVIAKEFCERGIVLHKGKLTYDGPIRLAIKEYKRSIGKLSTSAEK